LLALLFFCWPEEVHLLWGTEPAGLQLLAANQDLFGHCVERSKGLALKLFKKKKST